MPLCGQHEEKRSQSRTRGLTVTRETSREAMEEFFRLNCLTRKRHGLPPQPAVFFKKIYEHIISPKYGSVFLRVIREAP